MVKERIIDRGDWRIELRGIFRVFIIIFYVCSLTCLEVVVILYGLVCFIHFLSVKNIGLLASPCGHINQSLAIHIITYLIF